MKKIVVPAAIRDGELTVVSSVSGGKDSTALILALREVDVPSRYVFANTQWEAQETYEYLDTLRLILGITIDTVGVAGGMVERIRHRAGFPARMQRWCTKELKLEPLRAYHDTLVSAGIETASAMGIRSDESPSRALMAEWEDDDDWGGWVWRPLISWTVEDVIAIHRRHGVPMNPLYHLGHDRVGCYPCIYARKDEIRLVAEHAPHRIATIRELESEVVQIRARRNEEKPGRYEHMEGTFFQGRTHRSGFAPIDTVVEWSKTANGGRQHSLFSLFSVPTGGCMRWGMCEAPPTEPPGMPVLDLCSECRDCGHRTWGRSEPVCPECGSLQIAVGPAFQEPEQP